MCGWPCSEKMLQRGLRWLLQVVRHLLEPLTIKGQQTKSKLSALDHFCSYSMTGSTTAQCLVNVTLCIQRIYKVSESGQNPPGTSPNTPCLVVGGRPRLVIMGRCWHQLGQERSTRGHSVPDRIGLLRKTSVPRVPRVPRIPCALACCIERLY